VSNDVFDFKTDYLFLLVGTNPLPNYVAALLLASKSNIFLMHTGGAQGTYDMAKRLKGAMERKLNGIKCELYEVDDSEGPSIYQKVKKILEGLPNTASVGLHYTGGTKPMSVYTYKALHDFTGLSRKVFSYLNPRVSKMIVESNGNSTSFSVGDKIKVGLREMMDLHGYKVSEKKDINLHPCFYAVLANELQQKNVLEEWKKWIKTGWNTLPDQNGYPLLKNIISAFDVLCETTATPELVTQKLGRFDRLQNRLQSYTKWFNAEWLEEYVFWAIDEIAVDAGIHDYDINLKQELQRKFEIDVVAVKGYQLFAISCAVSDDKSYCKNHLFEIYVRARQIGGDEARIGLITFYDDHSALQKEIDESWFTEGKVKVFDRQILQSGEKLKNGVKEWFKTIN